MNEIASSTLSFWNYLLPNVDINHRCWPGHHCVPVSVSWYRCCQTILCRCFFKWDFQTSLYHSRLRISHWTMIMNGIVSMHCITMLLSITDVGLGTIATMLQWSISRNEWFLTTGWRVQMTGNMREQALHNQISHLRSQFISNQVDLEYEWLTRGVQWALDNQKLEQLHTAQCSVLSAHPSPSYKSLVVAVIASSSTLSSTQKTEMHS